MSPVTIELIGRATCSTCREAMALLQARHVAYLFRDYAEHPLSVEEIHDLLVKLDLSAHDVLRRRDPAFLQLGLTGRESAATLIRHMAAHPGLLERPIGVVGQMAVLGRPPERLLELCRPDAGSAPAGGAASEDVDR